jgi:protease II
MGRTEGFQYAVSSHGNYWYIKTNEEGAHNFKGKSSWKFETVTKLFSNNSFRVVIKVPVGEPMNKDLWETILEHREDVLIKEIELFRHHFVVWEWENGTQKVRIQDLSDGGTELYAPFIAVLIFLFVQRFITSTLLSLCIAFGLEKLRTKKTHLRRAISTQTDFDSVTLHSYSPR